jgi:hypothetical protein
MTTHCSSARRWAHSPCPSWQSTMASTTVGRLRLQRATRPRLRRAWAIADQVRAMLCVASACLQQTSTVASARPVFPAHCRPRRMPAPRMQPLTQPAQQQLLTPRLYGRETTASGRRSVMWQWMRQTPLRRRLWNVSNHAHLRRPVWFV